MKRFALTICTAVALAACGGGDGGGSTTPPAVSPLTGTYKAAGLGGVFDLTLNVEAGTLSYMQPDIATTTPQNIQLSGMTRAADGAYQFATGLTAGGQALNVRLYRVDDQTLSGVILTAVNGSQSLGPVLATRAPLTDAAQLNGDWNMAYYECKYDAAFSTCIADGTQGYGLSFNISNLVVSVCANGLRYGDCPAVDREHDDTLSAVGNGQYSSTTAGVSYLAMNVAGQRMLVSPYRVPEPDLGVIYVGYSIYVPEAPLSASAVDGSWRALNTVGATGTASIMGTALTTTMAARTTALAGMIAYDSRWAGMNLLTPTADPLLRTHFVANPKVGFLVNDEGLLLLTRE